MSDKVRIVFEYEMYSGYMRVGTGEGEYPLSLFCTETGETTAHHSRLIPRELWERYHDAVVAMAETMAEIRRHYDGSPHSLSEEESADARAAWLASRDEDRRYYLEHPAARLEALRLRGIYPSAVENEWVTCEHRDNWGSLFLDGRCMLCRAVETPLSGAV